MGWIADLLKEIPASSVLKERIALIEQKQEELLDEIAHLREDKVKLEEQILVERLNTAKQKEESIRLQEQLDAANVQYRLLEKRLEEQNHRPDLDKTKQSILALFLKKDYLYANDVAPLLHISEVGAEHHFDVIQNYGLVDSHPTRRGSRYFSLSKKGREYLVENGIA